MILHLSLWLFSSVVIISFAGELEVWGSNLADGAFFTANEQCSDETLFKPG
jgi:hypothetical protein